MKEIGIVTVILGVALPCTVQAADGAIPINSACAAVGCGYGDGAGFPVTLTNSGSYILTSDLIVPAGQSGVQISDGSSLDLNGFSIRGPIACTTGGVAGGPVISCTGTLIGTGLQIGKRGRAHGGRIEGFGSVGVSADTDARLYDLIITNNGSHGVAVASDASIEHCTIAMNLGNGVSALTGTGQVEVSRSYIRANGQVGIAAGGGLVLQNQLDSNGKEGLRSNAGDANVAYALNYFNRNNNLAAQVVGGFKIGCNQIGQTPICP
jgi:hypothetical protein